MIGPVLHLKPRLAKRAPVPVWPSRQFGNNVLRIVGRVLFAAANLLAGLVLLGMVMILCRAMWGGH